MGGVKIEEIKCVNNRESKKYMLISKENNIKVHDCNKGGTSGYTSLKE